MKNLTTLALNLVIAENVLHRIQISHQIIELLETSVEFPASLEGVMRNQFMSLLSNCVENPASSDKSRFFEMVDFYQQYFIIAPQPTLAWAA